MSLPRRKEPVYTVRIDKETIRQNILDYRGVLSLRTFITRDIAVDHEFARRTGKATAILGPRRAGKSTLLLQLAAEMRVPDEARVHVDFSEVTWSGFDARDPRQWQVLYEVALEFASEPVFFLDEIQELNGWAPGLLYLLNRGCRVIVTGSNRTVFYEAMASALRGKVLPTTLSPLSFGEYLRFRDVAFVEPLTSALRARRRSHLLEYLRWGGLPEVVLAEREELKRSLLESYLDVMLLRDVIERHRVQNVHVLQYVLRRVLTSFTKDISVNRWYNEVKSQGFRVGKDTLYEYVSYLEQAGFLVLLSNLVAPQGSRKAYLIDNGYYQRVQINPDTGKLLENRVCLDLVHDSSLRFYRDSNGEVDFVTGDRLIQACAELTDDNAGREWKPLEMLIQRFPGRTAGIITIDSYPNMVSADS